MPWRHIRSPHTEFTIKKDTWAAEPRQHISGKIHYIELSNVDRENAVFIKRGLKKFHRSDDVIFAYCLTNNYVMTSHDIDLKETCEKVGCKLELIN